MFTCRRTLLNQIYSSTSTITTTAILPSEFVASFYPAPKSRTTSRNPAPKHRPYSFSSNARHASTPLPAPEPRPPSRPSLSAHYASPSSESTKDGYGLGYGKGQVGVGGASRLSSSGKEGEDKKTPEPEPEPAITLQEYLNLRNKRAQTRTRKKERELGLEDYHDLILQAQTQKNDTALNWVVRDLLELDSPFPASSPSPSPTSSYKHERERAPHLPHPEIDPRRQEDQEDIYKSKHTLLLHLLFSLDLARLWAGTVRGVLGFLSSSSSSSSSFPTISSTPTPTKAKKAKEAKRTPAAWAWIDSLTPREFRYLVVQVCTRVHPSGEFGPGPSEDEHNHDHDVEIVKMVLPRVMGGTRAKGEGKAKGKGKGRGEEEEKERTFLGFVVLARLLRLRTPSTMDLAIPLFRKLLKSGVIPIDAVYSLPEGTVQREQEKLRTVLSMTLVGACVRRDFRTLGMRVLEGMFPSSDEQGHLPPLSDLIPLTTDVLYASLVSPRPSEFRACVALVKRLCLLEGAGVEALVRMCYSVGFENGREEYLSDCVGLYAFTRRDQLQLSPTSSPSPSPSPSPPTLPGPPPPVLLWLLKGITEEGIGARPDPSPHNEGVRGGGGGGGGAQSALARVLVSEVAGVPNTNRPCTATPGVPLLGPIFLPTLTRAEFIALAAMQGFGSATRVLYGRYGRGKDGRLVVGNPGVLVRVVGCFESVRRGLEGRVGRRGVVQSSGKVVEGELLDTPGYVERERDVRGFLEEVLGGYVGVHSPLGEAKHEVLTSLARAYFVVGRVKEGFEVFKILLDRKEIPDMYDMNTALTVLAEDSPRSAAKLVSRMITKGIHPDSVTIGILLRWALAHNDDELVRDVISRWGHIGLDMKGLDMWIRNVAGDREGVRDAVDVLSVLKGQQGSGIARNVSLGKYLVYRALRAGDIGLGRRVFRDVKMAPMSRTKKENSSATPPSDDNMGVGSGGGEQTKSKRKRQSQSCDACRARKVRCARENPDDSKQSCKHCITLGIPCTYEYQPKKRGPPNLYLRRLQEAAAQQQQQPSAQPPIGQPSPPADSPIEEPTSPSPPAIHPSVPRIPIPPSRYPIAADFHYSSPKSPDDLSSAWLPRPAVPPPLPPLSYFYAPHRLEEIAPRDTISLIIALFFDFVYPLTPCVHKPSFMADLHARREERDPLFFALVMSTVASTLVQVPRSYLPLERPVVRRLAQTCHEASRHITVASYDPPTSMHVVVRYFDCVYHFCEGHDATQHAAFGEASHIAVTLRMHEESSYEGLDPIECEVRRRIFWLLFGADKSMSILLGRPICLRDEDCSVHFPKELDDEYITPSAYLPQPSGKTAIVSGLNYISRIFALLGEILVRIRVDKRSPPQGQFATARLEEVQSLHQRIMGALSLAPEPLCLKRVNWTSPRQPSPEYGGPGFRQATFAEVKDFFDNPNASRANALNPFLVMQANLYVTQQLVRFVIEQYRDELIISLQGTLDEQQVAEDREAVASDLLNILHSIPIQSIATNGPSLVHKVRFVASTLLDAVRKAETAPASAARAHAFLWDFLSILSEIERNYLLDDDRDGASSGSSGVSMSPMSPSMGPVGMGGLGVGSGLGGMMAGAMGMGGGDMVVG